LDGVRRSGVTESRWCADRALSASRTYGRSHQRPDIFGVRLWHLPPLPVRVVGRFRGAVVGTNLLSGRSPHSRGSGQCTHARHPFRRWIALHRNTLRPLVVRAAGSLLEAEKVSGVNRPEASCRPIKRPARMDFFEY